MLRIAPEQHPLLMAEPPLNSMSNKERLSQVRGQEVSSGVREQAGGGQQGSLPNLGGDRETSET